VYHNSYPAALIIIVAIDINDGKHFYTLEYLLR